MKKSQWLFLVCVFCVIPVMAQETCSEIVEIAINALDEYCNTIERNQICYGNVQVELTPYGDASLAWNTPGDIVSIEDIEAIEVSEMVEPDVWGLARMDIQANLPGTIPGQNVTFLLYGNVQIENAQPTDDNTYEPMQAIYLTTGVGDSQCAEAPDSGIIVQTPEGLGTIELVINEVRIELGSTVLIHSEANHAMWVFVLEGQATVTAEDSSVIIPQGAFAYVLIDENLHPTYTPSEPEYYDIAHMANLPLSSLPEEINPAEPADEETLEFAAEQTASYGTGFEGTWHNTDGADGSSQSLTFRQNMDGSYDITYIDLGATLCGMPPQYTSVARATGTRDGNTITATLDFQCYNPERTTLNGIGFSITLDPETNTLFDGTEVWSR